MRELGRMTYNMVREKKHGPMAQFTKENIWQERSMV